MTQRITILEDTREERAQLAEQVSRLQEDLHRMKLRAESAELHARLAKDGLDDALDLLRDWEDYEPDDPECTWGTRRDAFLEEHGEAAT